MTQRWVKKNGDVIEQGPMRLPTYLHNTAGDPIRSAEMTEQQIVTAGWTKVEQVRRPYDRRFERELSATFEMRNGVPTDVFSYEFLPGARDYMIAAIDQQAEFERRKLITALPAQMDEYAEAVHEAQMCKEDQANGITPAEGEYAYLEADIGVTPIVDQQTGEVTGMVSNIFEAADVILAMRRHFKAAGAEIRRKRLAAKAAVRAAATDAEAMAAVHEYSPAVTEMFTLEPNSTHPFDEFNEVWNPNLTPKVED